MDEYPRFVCSGTCTHLVLVFGVWCFGFEIWVLRFGVRGLGLGVWGLGYGVWGMGYGVWNMRVWVWGLGCGIWGLCFRFGFNVSRFGVSCSRFVFRDQVSSIAFRISGQQCMSVSRVRHSSWTFFVSCFVFRVSGSGFGYQGPGFGCRVLRSGFRVSGVPVHERFAGAELFETGWLRGPERDKKVPVRGRPAGLGGEKGIWGREHTTTRPAGFGRERVFFFGGYHATGKHSRF